MSKRGSVTVHTALYQAASTNIAAEEGGHIEIVSAAINSCLNGPRTDFDDSGSPGDAPWKSLPGGIFGGK